MSIQIMGNQEKKTMITLAIAGLHQDGEGFDLLLPSHDDVTVYRKDCYDKAVDMLNTFEYIEHDRNCEAKVEELLKDLKWIKTCLDIMDAGESLEEKKGRRGRWFKFLASPSRRTDYSSYFVWVHKAEVNSGQILLPAI
jgi:hypothetical protein